MADTRPNILWYCTDQQRFDTIGLLGNPHVRTPTLDRLATEGVAFTHAYCQSPICTPSRSSFLTGLYPSRVHNTRNGNETFPDFPPLITGARQLWNSCVPGSEPTELVGSILGSRTRANVSQPEPTRRREVRAKSPAPLEFLNQRR